MLRIQPSKPRRGFHFKKKIVQTLCVTYDHANYITYDHTTSTSGKSINPGKPKKKKKSYIDHALYN